MSSDDRDLWAFLGRHLSRRETEFDPDSLWAGVRQQMSRPPMRTRAERWRPVRFGGISAALFAAMVVAVFRLPHLHRASWHDYVTAAGQRQKVTLPDGTAFTLAPASRLRVPFDYATGDRAVVLNGEAYFVVTHNAAHPFSVRAHDVVATDIGTQFDVRAYANDRDVQIAVTDGLVGINTHRLAAGDLATVADTVVAITHGADVAGLTAWTQGDLRFRDTPMPEVAAALGRWFDLDIDATNPALAHRLITMSVGNTSVDEVLSGVAAAAHARMERRGRHVTFTANPND